ncbi:hypothetical protein [Nocardiopsis metallicus]|uniref:Lipoprotein n=1 Tax=Nocardiopsis metallicus TaxID=179819 RepID=A0A840WPL2_9ACTN|nr:hypothetical protein [Nocardiopsis metallicus]MBB5494951.1 hypothetical protein [Nocardiopsis metallicus]
MRRSPDAPPPARTAGAVLAALLLVGCSSQSYDQDAHRDLLEAHGLEVHDMDAVTEFSESTCDATSAGACTNGCMDSEGDAGLLVIAVEQMCPERLEGFEEALEPYGR